MPRKIKIAIVKPYLGQSGAERYTYELATGLNRDEFKVKIVTTPKSMLLKDYYVIKLRQKKIPVLGILPAEKRNLKQRQKWFRILLILPIRIIEFIWHSCFRAYLNYFDLVAIIQVESWDLMNRLNILPEFAIVHLMSHQNQYKQNPYKNVKKSNRITFICSDKKQVEEITTSVEEANYYEWPLPINPEEFSSQEIRIHKGEPFNIGIFIRSSSERPITPIAKSLIRAGELIPLNCFFFGRGEFENVSKVFSSKKAAHRVKFPGHADNLKLAIEQNQINLVIGACMSGSIGYSGIEIGLLKIPQLFYYFGNYSFDQKFLSKENSIIAFDEEEELARAIVAIYEDKLDASKLVNNLYCDIIEKHDKKNIMKEIENIYKTILSKIR